MGLPLSYRRVLDQTTKEGRVKTRIYESDEYNLYRLGVDIGSTTVKVAVLDQENRILFSDYERHYANIQETLAKLLKSGITD